MNIFKITIPKTICFILLSFFVSCQSNLEQDAKFWTAENIEKVIQESNQKEDSTYYDTVGKSLWLFKKGKILKVISYHPYVDKNGKFIIDSNYSIKSYYSINQNFIAQKATCSYKPYPFENNCTALRFRGSFYGYIEFRFCNGILYRSGYRYKDQDIGIWKTYDTLGKLIKIENFGKTHLLANLYKIH